jgi:hypothetical protein
MQQIEVALTVEQWNGKIFIFDDNAGNLFYSEKPASEHSVRTPATQKGNKLILAIGVCEFHDFVFKEADVGHTGRIEPAHNIPALSDDTYPVGAAEGSWKIKSVNKMAMYENSTKEVYENSMKEIATLFDSVLMKLVEANLHIREGEKAGVPRTDPLFFPKGIELIYISLKVGDKTGVTFAVAGPNAKYPEKKESNVAVTGAGSCGTSDLSSSMAS